MSAAEQYLEKLRQALPRLQRRRIVAEIRNHMADDVAAEVARGVDPAEAERLTIERLGPPEELASQFATPGRRMSTPVFAAVAATGLVVVLVAVFTLSHTRHAAKGVANSRVTTTAAPQRVLVVPVAIAALHRGTVVENLRVVQRAIRVQYHDGRVTIVRGAVFVHHP